MLLCAWMEDATTNKADPYAGATVSCGKCGVSRPRELAGPVERPPCPECGCELLFVTIRFNDSIPAPEDSVSFSLLPDNQDRGWRERWVRIQTGLAAFQSPQMEPISTETIHAAEERLRSFYVLTYHLKDALKDESGTNGVPSKTAVEKAITNDPDLALLADLANRSKHGAPGPEFDPRSGEWPVGWKVSGATSGDAREWRLVITFQHKGREVDGIEAAERGVEAWRCWLSHAGLI